MEVSDREVQIGSSYCYENRRYLLSLNLDALRSLGREVRSMCGLGEVMAGGGRHVLN